MKKKLKKNTKTKTNHTMRWKILIKFFFFSVACGNDINEIKLWKSTYRSLLIIGVIMIIPENTRNTRSTSIYYRVSPDSNDFNSKRRSVSPQAVVSIYNIWYIYLNIWSVICIRIGCYKYATPLPESIRGIVSAPFSPQLGSTVK